MSTRRCRRTSTRGRAGSLSAAGPVLLLAALLALAAAPGTAAGDGHSAVRSFGAAWVAPGGTLEVSVSARDFGAFGQVVETLPAGFAYAGSRLEGVETDGRIVRFPLFGIETFSYIVRAPLQPREYLFSGIVRDEERESRLVGGAASVRVGQPPTPVPAPTAIPTHAHTCRADRNADAHGDTPAGTDCDACTHCNANARADSNDRARSAGHA